MHGSCIVHAQLTGEPLDGWYNALPLSPDLERGNQFETDTKAGFRGLHFCNAAGYS